MFVYGYYYCNNEKKEVYVIRKKGIYILTDNRNLNEWFVNMNTVLEYCKSYLDRFERKE